MFSTLECINAQTKIDLKHILKHLFEGGGGGGGTIICQNYNLQISKSIEKLPNLSNQI